MLDLGALKRVLSLDADLFAPGQPPYEALVTPWNHRYANVRPAAILITDVVSDVQQAVICARSAGVPVVPRSNVGHNTAGYSTTTGLLIIMARFNAVTWSPSQSRDIVPAGTAQIDYNAGTVTVGAGALVGDLSPGLEADGYLIPAGRCPGVGIAGLVLGGGIGFNDKLLGLTCDQLVSTDLVLADGSCVTADETTNPDLFWACRGAAGNNFGIHTSFTFKFACVIGTVTVFSFTWSINSAIPAVSALQQVAQDLMDDPRLHMRIGLETSGRTQEAARINATASAIGKFYGTPADLQRLMADVLRVGTPQEQQSNLAGIQSLSIRDSAQRLAEREVGHPWVLRSAVLDAPLTAGQLQAVKESLLMWPGSENSDGGVSIALFALGGAVNAVAADATAFVHRKALFIAHFEVDFSDLDRVDATTANQSWLDNMYAAVFGLQGPAHSYQNFPDPDLTNWAHAYYGTNYPRLQRVKAAYDPTQYFTYPQGITPATTSPDSTSSKLPDSSSNSVR